MSGNFEVCEDSKTFCNPNLVWVIVPVVGEWIFVSQYSPSPLFSRHHEKMRQLIMAMCWMLIVCPRKQKLTPFLWEIDQEEFKNSPYLNVLITVRASLDFVFLIGLFFMIFLFCEFISWRIPNYSFIFSLLVSFISFSLYSK